MRKTKKPKKMKKLLIYNGNEIHYEKSEKNVKVNVTEFAKAFPNKNLTNIVNSKEIKEYVTTLSKLQNCSFADLVEVRKGSPELGGGTWANRLVALRIAQKLSTEFAIMVDTKIQELITTGKTEIVKTSGNGLQVGDRLFMPYSYVLERLEIPYNKYAMIAAIGRNKSEFIMFLGIWYVSEQYTEYLDCKQKINKHRLIFKEQNKILSQNNMKMNSLFPQIQKKIHNL